MIADVLFPCVARLSAATMTRCNGDVLNFTEIQCPAILQMLMYISHKMISVMFYSHEIFRIVKGLRPVLEGFVVPMHEGACETGSQIPRA